MLCLQYWVKGGMVDIPHRVATADFIVDETVWVLKTRSPVTIKCHVLERLGPRKDIPLQRY